MCGVAFDRLYQIGNQVVAPLELNIYIRPCGLSAYPQLHQAVLHAGQNENCQGDQHQNHNESHNLLLRNCALERKLPQRILCAQISNL